MPVDLGVRPTAGQDGDGKRHGEFVEQPTDHAAHEKQRDQHRDERHGERFGFNTAAFDGRRDARRDLQHKDGREPADQWT